MVDQITENQDNINRIKKQNKEEAKKLYNVENLVYDRTDKLDVFEQIGSRIT